MRSNWQCLEDTSAPCNCTLQTLLRPREIVGWLGMLMVGAPRVLYSLAIKLAVGVIVVACRLTCGAALSSWLFSLIASC